MISKFLQSLFENSIIDNYTAKPHHVVIYPLLLMATGTMTFVRDGWMIFGVFTFILGVGLGVFIIFAIGWEKATAYWNTMDSLITTMTKTNSPELWVAFWSHVGMEPPPQKIKIVERDDSNGKAYPQYKIYSPPVSPATMQVIANMVLAGRSFSEKEIVIERKLLSAPKFRSLQKDMRKHELLRPNSEKDHRQGFAFTKKGIDMIYQFASEGSKMFIKER